MRSVVEPMLPARAEALLDGCDHELLGAASTTPAGPAFVEARVAAAADRTGAILAGARGAGRMPLDVAGEQASSVIAGASSVSNPKER